MTVAHINFEGADALELKTEAFRLVAVREYGPRIAFFGRPEGENLLYWAPKKHLRGDWDMRGGHRVWVTRPGADECEDTYATDNRPCEVALFGNGFCLTGGRNEQNGTRRGICVKLYSPTAVLVDSFLINDGDMLYSGGIWAITCTVPTKGASYAIPIGDGSSWNTYSMVSFDRWAGHGGGGFKDPQISYQDDLLVVNPAGLENKRMVQSHAGIIAMSDPANHLTFAKKVDFAPSANYPLNCNTAFYVGPANFMVEMETMGPEQTLKPGQDLHHRETWTIKPQAMNFRNCRAADLRDLFQ